MRYITLIILFVLIACHKPKEPTQIQPQPITLKDTGRCWMCEIEVFVPYWDTVWCGTREFEQICNKTEPEIKHWMDTMKRDEPEYKRTVNYCE